MSSKKKLKHTGKWRALSKIPGLRPALTGLYAKTPSNIGKINALFKRLQYQARHPEKFVAVAPRSDRARKNLKGNPEGPRGKVVVPNFGYRRVRIVRGHLVREDHRKAGRDTLIIRAKEVVGPGANIVERVRALDPDRFARHRGQLMVQIGDRTPFSLTAFTGRHTGSGLARASQYYLKKDQPEAVASALEDFRWNDPVGLDRLELTMHIVQYERKPL